MGLINWFQDKWMMMMRTKPQYISNLGRKRSSIKSPTKLSLREGKLDRRFGAFVCIVTMLYSVSSGVLLVLSGGIDSSSLSIYLVSLIIAGIAAICNGLSLTEYINNQSQEVPSIYSCCYQYSSEVLAFFIGWTWIISQTAVISAICKILSNIVNDWANDMPRKFLEKIFQDYAKDMPSLIFVLIFILFILTGFGETLVWYAIFIPVAFIMISAMYIIGCTASNNEYYRLEDVLNLQSIHGIDEILSKSCLCILFFSGPQNLLRVPLVPARKSTAAVLVPSNIIILVITFIFMVASSLWNKFIGHLSSNEVLSLVSNILCTISLCSIGIEAFFPLHFTIEDMSSDGLLFRSLSKKWKPFCLPVASVLVHILTFIFVGLMCIFMSLIEILSLAALFPLLVGSIIPYLVLIQRYRNNSTWQYEPMLHMSAKKICRDQSQKKSQEFQYSHAPGFDITDDCAPSTTCIEENLSETSSSDTDIDAVVQQYKDQNQITNMRTLDDSTKSDQINEPTASSSLRAKLCIVVLMFISFTISVIVNIANFKTQFSAIIVMLLCILFSFTLQSILMYFPQNRKNDKNKGCCAKIPSIPYIPGIASMISCSLLLQTLIVTWKISLGYFLAGTLLYFFYGMHSSTAANSFYNMRTTHITLHPLPSYGSNCIPQIIPSQQKSIKSRKSKIKTGKL